MVDFSRLLRDGMRLVRMYQRYSKDRGTAGAGTTGRHRPATGRHGTTTHARGRTHDVATPGRGPERPYPGDHRGALAPQYSPQPDGRPDPGEVVWTWVPYEEDHTRGKDRPVLIVDRSGDYLLCLMLTSKEHDTDGHDDPDYVSVGTGPWDRQGRESQVKLDRVIRVLPQDVRREGAVLPRAAFEVVARELASRR